MKKDEEYAEILEELSAKRYRQFILIYEHVAWITYYVNYM